MRDEFGVGEVLGEDDGRLRAVSFVARSIGHLYHDE